MARAKGEIAPAKPRSGIVVRGDARCDSAAWATRRVLAAAAMRTCPGRAPVLPRARLSSLSIRFAGIDRANAERLKRGLHAIEARLDLHGMTQAEAHRELIGFVVASHEVGRRCVLVITGRGLGPDGPGVLKSAVPRWLEEAALRRRILAVAAAQPRHGGAGALYLLLRRQR